MTILKLAYISVKKTFAKPKIYLYIIVGVVVLLCEFLSVYVDKFILGKAIEQISFVFALTICLDYTVFPFIFVPMCTLAGSLGFCEDMSHEFQYSILSRISKKQYINGRIVSSALIGGIVGASMIIVGALLLRVLYPSHSGDFAEYYANVMDSTALHLNGWGYVFKIAVAYFFGGAALSVIGLASSAILINRYVAILTPLLIFLSIHLISIFSYWRLTPLYLLMCYGYSITLFQSFYYFGVALLAGGFTFAGFAKLKLEGK